MKNLDDKLAQALSKNTQSRTRNVEVRLRIWRHYPLFKGVIWYDHREIAVTNCFIWLFQHTSVRWKRCFQNGLRGL